MKDETLEGLRDELGLVDRRLLELVGERQRLAGRIGRHKAERGIATRDYRQEKEVLERVRRAAAERGIDGEMATELFSLLIRSSLTVQERDRVAAGATGSGRVALVIGGAGRIGSWFARFLDSQGFAVTVSDPAGAPVQPLTGPPRTMAEIERQAILETLQRTHGRRAEAAKILKIGLRTLQRKLKEYREQGLVEE